MTSIPGVPAGDASSFAAAHPLVVLVDTARGAAPYELAALVDSCAMALGAHRALVYLADLQQRLLVPLVAASGSASPSLAIDATLAGRAFQTYEVQLQDTDEGRTVA